MNFWQEKKKLKKLKTEWNRPKISYVMERRDRLWHRFSFIYGVGEIDQARKQLEHVCQHYPNHGKAHFRLPVIENEDSNSFSKALEHFKKAHQNARHKSDILYERAELHHLMCHLDQYTRDKRRAIMVENVKTTENLSSDFYEVS